MPPETIMRAVYIHPLMKHVRYPVSDIFPGRQIRIKCLFFHLPAPIRSFGASATAAAVPYPRNSKNFPVYLSLFFHSPFPKAMIYSHIKLIYSTICWVQIKSLASPGPASLCGLLPCKDSWKGRYKHAGPLAASFAALVPLRDYPSGSVPWKEPCRAAGRTGKPGRVTPTFFICTHRESDVF